MFQYNNIMKDAIIIMSQEADKKRKEVPERIGAYNLLKSRQAICLLNYTYRYQETGESNSTLLHCRFTILTCVTIDINC